MSNERERLADELDKHESEFASLSDRELRGEMLIWKQFTPQWQAASKILSDRERERDPSPKTIARLAARVENIERSVTRKEIKTLALWISLLVLLATIAMLAIMLYQVATQQ